ncbi:MAG: hypothetical protein LBI57_02105 [Helicobacteraceae bacterium]|jgi:hypothetical protein|nr:hypothetical protein [Helicobacteraceae bacterium]
MRQNDNRMRERALQYDIFIHVDGDGAGAGAKAGEYYANFLREQNYGRNAVFSDFLFFVEKEIDFNRQNDVVPTSQRFGLDKRARLTLHFDYDLFSEASDDLRYKIALNAILYLLNYWRDSLKAPKGFPLDKVIADYQKRLNSDNLLDKTFENIYIKLHNPFRFSFMRRHVYALAETDIRFNTNDIEKHLNNNLYKRNFGDSIREIFFYYDIFDFNDSRYQRYIDGAKPCEAGKEEDLLMLEQYDSVLFIGADKKEQIRYLSEGILNAIKRIEKMKQKPKKFNVEKFYETIKTLMNEYAKIA